MSKPFAVGAYAHQRLNLVANGKASGRDAKASNRTWEIRPSGIIGGASRNVAMAELRTHLATERVRVVSLRLKQTRPSSIPTIEFRPSSTLPCCSRVTLVLYRKRTARRFRLASTSGVRFRYSRQKEAARGCGGRGALWEFNRFLPEKPCQTGTLAKTILLIFTM